MINDDHFRGKPFLAAQTMIDFTLKVDKLGEDITAQQGFDLMSESLALVLMPDSMKRFKDRMIDPSNPYAAALTGQPPIEALARATALCTRAVRNLDDLIDELHRRLR